MMLKVKHRELDEISRKLKNDSELFDDEITNMIIEIEVLRGIWQGADAEIFCNNVGDYVEKMNNITIAMRNMSDAITTTDRGYESFDKAFGAALKEEADNYDE